MKSLRPPLIIKGDAQSALRDIPSDSINCVVTSPPYWGMRDYNTLGQIGLEETLDGFIANIAAVFSELHRILKPDGSIWVNLSDSYTSGNRKYRAPDKKNSARAMKFRPDNPRGLKDKELIGIPWRIAFALQEYGWYLRCDVIWNKPNAMPESVKDRPTRSHEYLFLLTKNEKYFYNYNSSRELTLNGLFRNRRTVWDINTFPNQLSHTATFPIELVKRCLSISTKPGDIVLDPFFGTGTVGLACKQLGLDYVGIEINPEYVGIAKKRLELPPLNQLPANPASPFTKLPLKRNSRCRKEPHNTAHAIKAKRGKTKRDQA